VESEQTAQPGYRATRDVSVPARSEGLHTAGAVTEGPVSKISAGVSAAGNVSQAVSESAPAFRGGQKIYVTEIGRTRPTPAEAAALAGGVTNQSAAQQTHPESREEGREAQRSFVDLTAVVQAEAGGDQGGRPAHS